jgi:hypothetical protein
VDGSISTGLTRTVASVFVTVIAAAALAAFVRWTLIERDDLGAVCDALSAPWWCELRMLVIRAFLNDAFGRSSSVLAALALWRRSAAAAYLAVAIGTWGMMLYTFTWSGVGVLGGAIALARGKSQRHENGHSQQQAR